MPHRFNPLTLPKKEHYYQRVREDAIALLRQRDVRARRVLELGCSSGATGEALKAVVGAERYVGIEQSSEAAARARAVLDHVVEADLDTARPATVGLADERFDLLLALDVLEHLRDPWDALAAWSAQLEPGGHAVLSVPNIANIKVLEDLAEGRWRYRDEGVLDATHLRFFTFEGIGLLVGGAGLKPVFLHSQLSEDIDSNTVPATGNELSRGRIRISDLTREQLIALATFRFILLARRE